MGGGFSRFGRKRSASLFVRARETPETFADVYVEYHPQVLRYFARQTLDPEVAFDLMAETFAELFAGLPRFRGDSEDQGRQWMWTIARHQLYRWRDRGAVERRNLERLAPPLEQEEYERIEELADLERFRPVLERALTMLTEDQRQVLQQRVVEHRDYDEIAREYGTTAVAVRVRVSRALRRLAAALDTLDALDDSRDTTSEELLT
ncbi:MAG TPA: sigma-70 family RNA polymerase sigma factor [Baekduia sp.]|jgi:RNA polymerase sigma-70 factor (ECF subfamily)|nr:sigma-70 family RNA polymerase sigma factor [Baekduia sp.]